MDEEMKDIMEDIKSSEADELLEKELNQVEKVLPVTKSMTDMGTFYKRITEKLVNDKICFFSKKPIGEKDPFDIIQVPDEKVPPGMVAFVSVLREYNTD